MAQAGRQPWPLDYLPVPAKMTVERRPLEHPLFMVDYAAIENRVLAWMESEEMGSSRDWAAEMEDKITTCRHGVETRYFEKCTCRGCTVDAEIGSEITSTLLEINYHYQWKRHEGKTGESLLVALRRDLEALRNGD